jgi:hypothetical protein
MKKLNLYTLALLIGIGSLSLVSCSGSKSISANSSKTTAAAFNPEGTWNIVIVGTPLGDLAGTLALIKNGNTWDGNLETAGFGGMPLNNISIENRTLRAAFDFQGTSVDVQGNFEEDDKLNGRVGAMGDSYLMKGERAK